MKEPKMPTPEEVAQMQKKRILSDAKLVSRGADVTPDGKIMATEEQIMDAKIEMGEHFYNKLQELEADEKTKKNLPSLDFVKNHLAYLGGTLLIVGLTRKQADAIINLMEKNNLEISEDKLSEHEVERLSKRSEDVTPESITLRLGTSEGCEKGLFGLLSSK